MAENRSSRAAVEAQLRAFGRTLVIADPPESTVQAVMARLELEPVPAAPGPWRRVSAAASRAGSWVRDRWRIAGAVLAAAVLALFVASPAGAGIREWLGFGGVVVVQDAPGQSADGSADPPSSAAALPNNATEVSLAQARSMVGFDVGVPPALGDPDRVGVSDDGRVVFLQWSDTPDGPIELDQIAGSPDPYVVKKFYQDVEFTAVDGREALWLAQPHPLVVVAPDRTELTQTARQSGPSLIWQHAGVTLRLEGVADRDWAVEIAQSLQY